MNIVIIASAVLAATLIVGSVLASAFVRLSNVVAEEQATVEKEKSEYNPSVTAGHQIPTDADFETQLKEARILAAKRAAALPRGANLGIGRFSGREQLTAFDGVKRDPVSAVRIAAFHGWGILGTGASAGTTSGEPTVQTAAQTVAPTKSPEELEPGKDYPFIEITESMTPAEKRKARIANAKARSAAVKALKEAAGTVPAAATGGDGATAREKPTGDGTSAQVAQGAGREPVAGVDYPVIEITEDMDPAEIRKARIANAKARSAAMKAFKESGGTAQQAAKPQAAASEAEDAVKTTPEAKVAIPADIPRPDYIEITDDMEADELRKARIHNAKARSAYHKALKAAGIDPATVTE